MTVWKHSKFTYFLTEIYIDTARRDVNKTSNYCLISPADLFMSQKRLDKIQNIYLFIKN